MKSFRIRNASEQVADFLRGQIQEGEIGDWMPGESRLASELSAGRSVVSTALKQLEREGWIRSDGRGKRRRVCEEVERNRRGSLKVSILPYDRLDRVSPDTMELLSRLHAAGISADFAGKSLHDLGMEVERVARFVERNPADAWVTCSASRPVNEWFAGRPQPVLAMFGRIKGIPMAGAFPIMIPGMLDCVRSLLELGHQRIVMFTRRERREPQLSRPERSFLEALEGAGIKTGDFNLPDWVESPEGLLERIDQLFRVRPPTALIFQEADLLHAARYHLALGGVLVPRDVSMVFLGNDSSLAWCRPRVSHVEWDHEAVVRRVVRWAIRISNGKRDLEQSGTRARYVQGETVGPPPSRSKVP
jgi:DNA-binding transcriptional regulator YhcF (GntR family)